MAHTHSLPEELGSFKPFKPACLNARQMLAVPAAFPPNYRIPTLREASNTPFTHI